MTRILVLTGTNMQARVHRNARRNVRAGYTAVIGRRQPWFHPHVIYGG